MKKLLLLTMLFSVVALAACAKDPVASESTETAKSLSSSSAPPSSSPSPVSATLAPTGTPAVTASDSADETALLKAKAVEALARHLNVEATTITLESLEAVSWGDTSLGCPEPGKMYAQVVTEGHKAWLRFDGKRYPVHMTSRGAMVCTRSMSNMRQGAVSSSTHVSSRN